MERPCACVHATSAKIAGIVQRVSVVPGRLMESGAGAVADEAAGEATGVVVGEVAICGPSVSRMVAMIAVAMTVARITSVTATAVLRMVLAARSGCGIMMVFLYLSVMELRAVDIDRGRIGLP